MKILIASDLHGDAAGCRALLAAREREGAEEVVLLGDLLYHGPRNDLPPAYAPKEVSSLLSSLSPAPLCVRGNCDAEVDQMVLPFPILADYAQFVWDGVRIFATHGHHASPEALPPSLRDGDVFLSGHTHLYTLRREEASGVYLLNPGSPSLPKGDNVPSYLLYENRTFTLKDLSGNVLSSLSV